MSQDGRNEEALVDCETQVALLGFEKGHDWALVPGGKAAKSTALYCTRCGENGWRIG